MDDTGFLYSRTNRQATKGKWAYQYRDLCSEGLAIPSKVLRVRAEPHCFPNPNWNEQLQMISRLSSDPSKEGNQRQREIYRKHPIAVGISAYFNQRMKSLLGTCHRCPRCHAPLELMESPSGFYLTCPNFPFCRRFEVEGPRTPNPDYIYRYEQAA